MAWANIDVPGTIGTMGVAAGMTRARNGARRTGQGVTTAWNMEKNELEINRLLSLSFQSLKTGLKQLGLNVMLFFKVLKVSTRCY